MDRPKALITPLCGIERTGWLNPMLAMSLIEASHNSHFDVVIEPAFALSPVDYARNVCVSAARDRGFDWLLMVDNDQTLPPFPLDVLTILTSAGPQQNVVGFACGISLDGGKSYIRNSEIIPGVADGSFMAVSRIGAGVMAIHRSVWQAIPKGPWFRTLHNEDELLSVKQSEDLFFCDLAKAAGLKLWMARVGAGHLKTVNLTTLTK